MKTFLIILFLTITTNAQVFKEVKEIDKVEIAGIGSCQIRQVTKILKDNVEISRSYHRWSIDPEGDLSLFDSRVKSICKAAWTSDVIKKYKDQRLKELSRFKK